MNLLQKYIQAVKQELPAQQREDIGRELQANILDQLDAIHEQTGREATQDEVAAILEKLGHPARVAAGYAPEMPLVSAELMPVYRQVLSYGMGIALLLQSLKSAALFMQAGHDRIMRALLQLLAGFIDQATWIFMIVTLLFYVGAQTGALSYWTVKKDWRVQNLPDQRYDWQHIRGSDLVTDLASCGFVLLLIWHKLWMSVQGLQELRVDFSSAMSVYLPWMTILLCASVLFSIWCVFQPVWSSLKLRLNMVQNVLYALLFLLFSQLDALIVNTGVPAILDLQRLDRVIRLACLVYAIYLLYQTVRDGRRLMSLRQTN
ncbi:hypothetical protein ACO0LM_04455 [Undibacterium sp. Di26W]|uniref:hypothetical protein n=1 Tax=Undibacterium sp. Di26W TaxID=3413035 RepID=UPI003BEFCA5F